MTSSRLRIGYAATVAIIPLAGIATLGGLLVSGLYGEGTLAPAMRGQDLLTLVTLPFLVLAMLGARRGSARGMLLWLGLLGYELYTFIGAAFAYHFNRLFLVYVALFTLSALALGMGAAGVDAAELHRRMGARAPRRPVAIFLAAIALMLLVSELGQIVPALVTGAVPPLIARSEGAGNFVYVLDLGVIAPLAVLAAVGLHRRLAWADVLAGCLVIKAATMGLALLAMTWFSVRAGQPLERGLTVAYAVMAALGLAMAGWLFARASPPRMQPRHDLEETGPLRARAGR